MKMKRMAYVLLLFLLLAAAAAAAPHLSGRAEAAGPVTTTDGWLTDLDGNLITDEEGYYVLTLSSDMISGGRLSAGFNPYAALFLEDFKNVSGTRTTKKLKVINNSGGKISYEDYEFTTENVLPRTENIFNVSTGSISNALNRGFGSAYTAMVPTITSPDYRTDLCLDVEGFDGKNINIMIANLRAINQPVLDFYGLDYAYELTLPQMMHLDANLTAAGYLGYADYLKKYYGVASLYDLPLTTAYHVLGTSAGAQTGVTNWMDNTPEGKAIPASELGQLTNEFKIWGILGQNLDPADQSVYPYCPSYFMMETDPEVIRFAFDYLYANGLRFSFDQNLQPFDTTDSEYGMGGVFGIKAYLDKDPAASANVADIFEGMVLDDGEYFVLDNVTAGLYVPNAWNQFRLYDFGFKLIFAADQPWILLPRTGDDANLLMWGAIFGISTGGAIGMILLAMRNRRRGGGVEH